MEQKTENLYPSAPVEKENFDLEQRLKKKVNVVNSFRNSIKNFKELITYCKDENHKSRKK